MQSWAGPVRSNLCRPRSKARQAGGHYPLEEAPKKATKCAFLVPPGIAEQCALTRISLYGSDIRSTWQPLGGLGSALPYGPKIFAADAQPQTAPEELHGEREASRRKDSGKLHAPGVVSTVSAPRISCIPEPDRLGVDPNQVQRQDATTK